MNALNRLLIGVACSVIIVAGMRAASDIVRFVLFAGLLATCISPFTESLVRHGLTRSLALLITILVVIVGSSRGGSVVIGRRRNDSLLPWRVSKGSSPHETMV